MCVQRIRLIQIQFEEFVMDIASEVLVAENIKEMISDVPAPAIRRLRTNSASQSLH